MIEIWLVTEDPLIQEGFAPLLEDEGLCALVLPDLASAARFVQGRPTPDLLVVDISSRRDKPAWFCNVIVATRALHEVPRIVINEGRDPRQRYDCFMCGSAGYFQKPFVPGDLLARIKHVVSRPRDLWSPLRDEVLQVGPLQLDCASQKARIGGRDSTLSAAQVLILRHFMLHPGEVVRSDSLLVEALGYPPAPVDDTDIVRLQIWNLRRRLEADPARPAILVTVPNAGYQLAVGPVPQAAVVPEEPCCHASEGFCCDASGGAECGATGR